MGLQRIWHAVVKFSVDQELQNTLALGFGRLDALWLSTFLSKLNIEEACDPLNEEGGGKDVHGGRRAVLEVLRSAVDVAETMLQSGEQVQTIREGRIDTVSAGGAMLKAVLEHPKLLGASQHIIRVLKLYVEYPSGIDADVLSAVCEAAKQNGAMAFFSADSVLLFAFDHAQPLRLTDADLARVASCAIAGGLGTGQEIEGRRYLEAQAQLLRKVLALAQGSQDVALSDQAAGVLADLLQNDPSAAEQLLFPELPLSMVQALVFMAVEQQQPEALLQLLQHSLTSEQLQSFPLWVLQLAAELPLPETAAAASVQMHLLGLLLQQGQQPPTAAIAALLQAINSSPEQWQLFLEWLSRECRSAPPSAAAGFLSELLSLSSQDQQQVEEEQQQLSLADNKKRYQQQQLVQLSPDQQWQLYELLQSCQEGWNGEQQGLPAAAADAIIQQQGDQAGVEGRWARRVLVVWEHFCRILPSAELSANGTKQLNRRTQQLVLGALVGSGAYAQALEVVKEVPRQLGHLVAAWLHQQQQQHVDDEQQQQEGEQQQPKPALLVSGEADVAFLHGVLKMAVAEDTEAAAATAARLLEVILQPGVGRVRALNDGEVDQLLQLLCKYQVIDQISAAAKLLPYASSPEAVAAFCKAAAGCSSREQELLVKQLAGGVTENLQGLMLVSVKLLLEKKLAKAAGLLAQLHESTGVELRRPLSLAVCDALMQVHVKQLQPPKDRLTAERVVYLWQHVHAASGKKPALKQLQGPSQKLLIRSFVLVGAHQQALDLVQQVRPQLPQLAAAWQQHAAKSIGAKLLQSALNLANQEGTLGAVAAAEGFMKLAKGQQLQDAVLDTDLAVKLLQLYCKHGRVDIAAPLLYRCSSAKVVETFFTAAAQQDVLVQQSALKAISSCAGDAMDRLYQLLLGGLDLLLASKDAAAVGLLWEALQATKQDEAPLLPTLSETQQQQVAELSCNIYSSSSPPRLATPSFAPWCIAWEATLCRLPAETLAGLVTAVVRDREELQPCRAAVLLGVVHADQLLKVAESSSSSHQLARGGKQGEATAKSDCLAAVEVIGKLVMGCLGGAAGSLDAEKVEEAVGWVDRSVTLKVLSPEAAAAALFAVWYCQQQQQQHGPIRASSVAAAVLGLSLYHATRKRPTLSASSGWTAKPSLDSLVLDLALVAAAGTGRWQEGRELAY